MTITGLELRRATWEALGRKLNYPKVMASVNALPPIESNNGIALDELIKFCERTEWKVADIRICADSRLNTFRVELFRPSREIDELGTSLAECICRALIQAASVKANGR